MSIKKMQELDLSGKRVLIREDFNVPIADGKVTSDARLMAAIPTIQLALTKGAAVILLSHLGRPTEGQMDDAFSLAPVAARLSTLLGQPVRFAKEWLNGIAINPGEVVLCENVRFNQGELANDEALAKKMAALGDVFVMDAFATAHRAQASTYGIAQFSPVACGGPLLMTELEALATALEHPERPLVAIVGGSKVSGKLQLLEALLEKVDQLILGGGIANTFIAASGFSVGRSLYEPDLIPVAKQVLAKANARGIHIPLPVDVVVASALTNDAIATIKPVGKVSADDMILDVGPDTLGHFATILQAAKTILWNGPVGAFEFAPFAHGTEFLAKAIANSPAFSIAGGGDTIAAIEKYQISDNISYSSTGGGAFLEFIEGKLLPAIDILQQRAGD